MGDLTRQQLKTMKDQYENGGSEAGVAELRGTRRRTGSHCPRGGCPTSGGVDDEARVRTNAQQRERRARRPEQRSSEAVAEERRARRNAQQRERRARQRGLQVSEASESSAEVSVGVQLCPLTPLRGDDRESGAVEQERSDRQRQARRERSDRRRLQNDETSRELSDRILDAHSLPATSLNG
ncbi:hypothetical protein PHYPSEUDO_010868 [Phytophthora pseudosyringae]|uniref:Uncharacterized protein n=1 Tax=Phytophthora pseudosyringae TaxID=221518 RepID=A0A8T1VCQ2_9STRA|nr:hypothetical protein PHYPSEUDO_010868 [Phytophthora pseudosyringae]